MNKDMCIWYLRRLREQTLPGETESPDRDCLCGEYQLSPTYRRPENPYQDGDPGIPLTPGICWYLSKLVMVPGSSKVRG